MKSLILYAPSSVIHTNAAGITNFSSMIVGISYSKKIFKYSNSEYWPTILVTIPVWLFYTVPLDVFCYVL